MHLSTLIKSIISIKQVANESRSEGNCGYTKGAVTVQLAAYQICGAIEPFVSLALCNGPQVDILSRKLRVRVDDKFFRGPTIKVGIAFGRFIQ